MRRKQPVLRRASAPTFRVGLYSSPNAFMATLRLSNTAVSVAANSRRCGWAGEPGSRGEGVKRRSASAAKPIDGAQPCCIPGRKNYGACMKRTRISRATAASRQPHIMPDGNFNTRHLSTLFLTFPKSRLDVAPIHKHVYFPALLRVLTQRGQKATATIALNLSTCIPLLLGQNWIR